MRTFARALLVSILGCAALALIASPASATHWIEDSTFGPIQVSQGVTTNFTFNMKNGADEDLYVQWVRVLFCWNASVTGDEGVYFKPNDGNPTVIPALVARPFSKPVVVPKSANGECSTIIYAEGRTLTERGNALAQYTTSIRVLALAPLVVNVSAAPLRGQAPLEVQFRSDVSGGHRPYFYSWTFNDGLEIRNHEANRTFGTPGTFAATLRVNDSAGNQEVRVVSVVVIPPLTTDAEPSPDAGDILAPVTFVADTSGGAPPYTYRWDFGDGSTSSESSASHTYRFEGSYPVNLMVTDSEGNVATSVILFKAKGTFWSGNGAGVGPGQALLAIAVVACAVAAAAVIARSRRGKATPPEVPGVGPRIP